MFAISSIAAGVQAFGMMFLPKTPHYLMLCNDDKGAEAVITRLNLARNPRQKVAEIRASITAEDVPVSLFCICCTKSHSGVVSNMGTRLAIGVGIVLFQQFSGQPNIIYYAADVFRLVGFCSEFSSMLASVALGTMKVLSTVIALVLVDRIGRRKCFVSGLVVMCLCILTLSIISFYDSEVSPLKKEACSELVIPPTLVTNHTSSNVTMIPTNDTQDVVSSETLLSGESTTLQTLQAT